MLNEIKKDLLELRGSEVKIFGQATTLPALDDESIYVDITHLVEALADYEISQDKARDLLDLVNIEDVDALDYVYADNSYNWDGMGSNEFDYKVYALDDGENIVRIKFHRFGDVRGNYTDDAFLLFDDLFEFDEIVAEQFNDFYVVVDGLEFHCQTRITSQYVACSAKTDKGYLDLDVIGSDKYDVLTELVNELEVVA